MKKLFSLLILALISMQMWGAWSAKITVEYVTGCSSMGSIWIDKSSSSTSGSDKSLQVSAYTTAYLHAKANANYKFVGWKTSNSSGASNASTKSCWDKSMMSSTGTLVYYAYFELDVSDVTVTVALANGCTGMGSVKTDNNTTSKTVAAGTNVTITATANSNYYFKGWSTTQNGNTIVSNNASYTVSASDATYYAVFAAYKTSTVSPTDNNSNTNWTSAVVPDGYVDLGLPSGTLWAKKNLGGSEEYSVGNYYAWGSLVAKTSSYSNYFTTANYPSYANSKNESWTGDATYDAATAANSADHTPTKAEWEELIQYTTKSYGNGVKFYGNTGYLFEGNDNYIYLTTGTGVADGGYSLNASTYAHYWSSTLKNGTGTGKIPYYYLGGASYNKVTYQGDVENATSYCYSGMPIRPVRAGVAAKVLTIQVKVGSSVVATHTYRCNDGEKVKITADDDVNGYEFTNWKDGNSVLSTDATQEFTVTTDKTYTANYTESVTYVTATFKNADNTTDFATQQVVSGQAPTAPSGSPAKASTVSTVYTFDRWNTAQDGTGNGISTAITTATTYYPIYTEAARTYTIRFLMDDGTTVLSSAQVVYNGSPIEPSEPTKIGTEEYSYNFTGWTPAVTAVTGDQDYVAVFEQVAKAPKYNLTIGAFTNGSVTLTANGKTDVVPAAGGTYQYEEGTTIIVKAVPAKGYHFNQWNDANTAASRQVSEIAANMTLTPTFAVNAQFLMDDTWEQAAFISNCAAATGVLTVTLKDRTYSAGQWATLSVPFNCTLDQEDELYNAVYKLHTLTLAQDGGSVSFEFIRTNVVEANEPYLIVPRHDISEVIFHGVTLTTPAEVSRTTDDRVTFVSGLWKQTISGPNEFYVATGNSLRYASSLGTNVKGNRAFFRKINDAASSSAPRRAIMVIDGEEVEVEIAGDAIEEVQDVRKYIENGVLIIERNGVRMDAQGKRID